MGSRFSSPSAPAVVTVYAVWSTSVHAFVPCARQRFATLSRMPAPHPSPVAPASAPKEKEQEGCWAIVRTIPQQPFLESSLRTFERVVLAAEEDEMLQRVREPVVLVAPVIRHRFRREHRVQIAQRRLGLHENHAHARRRLQRMDGHGIIDLHDWERDPPGWQRRGHVGGSDNHRLEKGATRIDANKPTRGRCV